VEELPLTVTTRKSRPFEHQAAAAEAELESVERRATRWLIRAMPPPAGAVLLPIVDVY
jgi:hypothetical protein